MQRSTVLRRVALSGLATAGLLALGATSAAAHVTITPSTTAAGATAVLGVEIPHGCVGSATTAISIRMPEGVSDVTTSDVGRWAVEETADALTWTADEPLPDAETDQVELSLRLPDDVGAELVFPVIQQCEDGEVAWTEVAEHGEGHDGLERPAPVVVVTAGDKASAPAGAGTPDATADATTADAGTPSPTADTGVATASTDAAERDPLVTYGAAGLLVLAVLAAAAVLLRRRRP
jgi:uncharacterized protein (TIGR03382 family)